MGLFGNVFDGAKNGELKSVDWSRAFLVDVRESGEFANGSVKGAVNIPLGKIASQLALFEGKHRIVVFCRSGNRSGQARAILEQQGVKNVINGGSVDDVRRFVK